MSNYRTTGIHQLNKWLWSRLKTLPYKGGMAFGKYAGAGGTINLIPIVPSQQLPEFTEIAGGAPFIVYNYSDVGAGDMWFLDTQQAAFIIYDNDEERLRTIHTFMTDLLRRMDWTAEEINDWIYSGSEPGTQADPFEFKTVYVVSSNGPEPFEEQGGRQGAIVVAQFSYTHDLNSTPGSRGMRI